MMLVLSLFPGIGLLDMAFEQEGFCIVRGPDLLWGGDIKTFHPPKGKFDGVIGGPPCQAFSSLRFLVAHNGYQVAENLIPEYARCVQEAQPSWWLMENVRQAPDPSISGYQVQSFLFNNRWLGEEQNRVRRFWFGTRDGRRIFPEQAVFENPCFETAVLACELIGGMNKKASKHRIGCRTRKGRPFHDMCRLQGLPEDFALPPFTQEGKSKAVGNGVPLPMGRAIARAVKRALSAAMIGLILLMEQPAQAASRRGCASQEVPQSSKTAPNFNDLPQSAVGYASWYSRASAKREGNSGIMANGRRMEDEAFTAASWEWSLGTRIKACRTGKYPDKSGARRAQPCVTATITDRGPSKRLYANGRILDLSPAAFHALAPLQKGLIEVEIEEQILGDIKAQKPLKSGSSPSKSRRPNE